MNDIRDVMSIKVVEKRSRCYLQTCYLSLCIWQDYCRSVLQSLASHVLLCTVKEFIIHTHENRIIRAENFETTKTLHFEQDGGKTILKVNVSQRNII